MSKDLISEYITEVVQFDAAKAELNKKENDFSGHEYAEVDGKGVDE